MLIPLIIKVNETRYATSPIDWKNKSDIKLPWKPNVLLISLISYSPEDPNFVFPDNTEIKNLLGFQGSFISDLFLQSVGLVAYPVSLTFIVTGINIFIPVITKVRETR